MIVIFENYIDSSQVLEFVVALGQVASAVAVVYVARLAYGLDKDNLEVNKSNLKLALFEKRIKVFNAFKALFQAFLIDGRINDIVLQSFISETSDTFFLFKKEIYEYRQIVIDNSIRLKQLDRRLEGADLTSDKRTELANEAEKIERWFSEQFESLNVRFSKYLRILVKNSEAFQSK